METWKDVKDFEGLYRISDKGNIISLHPCYKNKNIKIQISEKGYLIVKLTKSRKLYQKRVHRLIAEVFIPNPLNKPQINHKDMDKMNNSLSNLEWVTNLENAHHALLNGSYPR